MRERKKSLILFWLGKNVWGALFYTGTGQPTTWTAHSYSDSLFFDEHVHDFLPARRYASAGYRDRNVSVRPSVCLSVCLSVRHAPVLCQNEES